MAVIRILVPKDLASKLGITPSVAPMGPYALLNYLKDKKLDPRACIFYGTTDESQKAYEQVRKKGKHLELVGIGN